MAVLWQSGKKGSRPAVLALLLGALCLTAGCQSTNESRTKTPDPLMGEKAPGVVYQQQDSVPGGVRFRCAVPSPQDPTVLERYEATAADYRSAVLAVLNQIDKSR